VHPCLGEAALQYGASGHGVSLPPVIVVQMLPNAWTLRCKASLLVLLYLALSAHALIVSPSRRRGVEKGANQSESALVQMDPDRGAVLQQPTPAVLEASNSFFMLRHVQYEEEANPGCCQDGPPAPKASMCLTAGRSGDALDGFELYYRECEEQSVLHPKVNKYFYEAQLFTLTLKGQFKSAAIGMCIRRVLCTIGEDDKYAYDLSPCDSGFYPETFGVQKVVRNDPNNLGAPRYPVQAVAADACQECGPFLVAETCSSEFWAPGCPRNYQAAPGWTKLPTQFVGEMAVQGYAGMTNEQFANKVVAGLADDADPLTEKISMGPSMDRQGICGTFAEDVPAFSGLYNLVKQHPQVVQTHAVR